MINYDLDTEDELAEENGEDLQDDNCRSDDNEDELEEQELQNGFIVDDDYLSDYEMAYSNVSGNRETIEQDKERRKQILQKNRESK